MITFSVKVKSVQKIPPLALTPVQTKIVTKATIQYVKDRVQKRHTDVFEVPMPSYSNRPVYVKIGVVGGSAFLKAGRIPITSLASLKKSGVKIINVKGRTSLKGEFKNAVVRSGNSIRFPNRAAYKLALGASGLRDLTETGAMLRAIGVVSQSGNYAKVITIGFKSAKEERKARGNATITNWFGLSPLDQVKVTRLITDMFYENLGLPTQFGTTKGFSTVSYL